MYLLSALSVFFLSLTPIRRFGDFAPSDFYVDPYAGGGAGLLFAAFSLISFRGRDSAAAFFLAKWAAAFILVSALVVAKLHLAAEVLFYSAAILMSVSDVLSLRRKGIEPAQTENDPVWWKPWA